MKILKGSKRCICYRYLPCFYFLIIIFFYACTPSIDQSIPSSFKPFIKNISSPIQYKEIYPQFDKQRARIPKMLSKEQALQDIDMLDYLFSTSYSGYEYWEVKGINFNVFFDKQKKIISLSDSINTLTFEQNISTLLKQFSDGHIAIDGYAYNYARGHKSVYFSNILVKKTTDDRYLVIDSKNNHVSIGDYFTQENPLQYLFPTLSPTGENHFLLGTMAYDYVYHRNLSFNDNILPISFNENRLLFNRHQDPKAFYIYQKDSINVLRINSLRNTLYPLMQEFITSGTQLKNEENLIIDVSDNGGGSSAFAQEFIKNLNGSVNWELKWAELVSPPIAEYYAKYLPIAGSEHAPHYLEMVKRYDSYYETLKAKPVKRWIFSVDKNIDSKGDFEGALYVLANRSTISGGEALVGSSVSVKNRILIGENTGGAGQFSSNTNFYLPNSKIIIRLPRHFIFIPDFKEGIGFSPDYWLDSSEPISEILTWIKDRDNYQFSYSESYPDMLKKHLNTIVLPEDHELILPGETIPEDLAKYSGKWFGMDGGVLEHMFVVEKINNVNDIHGIYAWGAAPQWGVKPGWTRMKGKYVNRELILTDGWSTATYTLDSDGSLRSLFQRPGLKAKARLIKI